MDSKILISGIAGFAAGVAVTLLVGLLVFGTMGRRGGMMRGWGCNRFSSLELPNAENFPSTPLQTSC